MVYLFRVVGLVRTVGFFLHPVKIKKASVGRFRSLFSLRSYSMNLTLQILLGIYIICRWTDFKIDLTTTNYDICILVKVCILSIYLKLPSRWDIYKIPQILKRIGLLTFPSDLEIDVCYYLIFSLISNRASSCAFGCQQYSPKVRKRQTSAPLLFLKYLQFLCWKISSLTEHAHIIPALHMFVWTMVISTSLKVRYRTY